MILAIDPGKAGAIAHLHPDGRFCCVTDMPETPQNCAAVIGELLIAQSSSTTAIIERVNAMPGQGVVSMFTFGMGYGILQGVLAARRVPYELVTPNVWKKEMGLGNKNAKEISRAKAQRLFPEAEMYLNLKKHEGRAEALLLGLWYARKLGTQPENAPLSSR